MRDAKEVSSASEQTETPHEPEARYGLKRETAWTGDKVHVTETCDDNLPHLMTRVETTIAPAADVEHLAAIQHDLVRQHLHPPSTWSMPDTCEAGIWSRGERTTAST